MHRSIGREYLEALLIAVVFALFARTFAFQAFKIPTGSMEQNLLVGDHILVNKFSFAPTVYPFERVLLPLREVQRGDVVVFKFPEDPGRDFIKRCIGLAGDRIEIVDKLTFVNGEPLTEDYTFHADPQTYPRSMFLHDNLRLRDNFGPYTVPEGSYFFMGDNRDNSNDSRFWGPVPESHVKGQAFMIYWSFDGRNESVSWPGFGGKLRQLAEVGRHFFTRTRWDRSFRLVR